MDDSFLAFSPDEWIRKLQFLPANDIEFKPFKPLSGSESKVADHESR
jgi:hypothetical protein